MEILAAIFPLTVREGVFFFGGGLLMENIHQF